MAEEKLPTEETPFEEEVLGDEPNPEDTPDETEV
jgi:hypothetical protein